MLNARERIDHLADAGSFLEIGPVRRSHRAEMQHKTPADGKIAGFAKIDGREVGLVSNDFTVLGASRRVINMKKIRHVKQVAAASAGCRSCFLGESSGRAHARPHGSAGRAITAQDPTEYQRLRETPVVLGAARPVLRLVDVVLGDVRFRGHAQRRDHGDREPQRDFDGDQQADRRRGARRLEAA